MSLHEDGARETAQEALEFNIKKNKERVTNLIRERLEGIYIGSYTDESDDYGEDIFGDPENFEQILEIIKSTIDSSAAENWTRERLIKELLQIKINFGLAFYKKNYKDFRAARKEEEPLSNYLDETDLTEVLHKI